MYIKLGTERIKNYLQKIHNPQDDLKIIHITGTNGKGSVARIISSILSITALQNHRNVGSFTSPALLGPHDGIQINGNPISLEQYQTIYDNIYDKEIYLTNFEKEVITAIQIFKLYHCEVCVIEAGMGGMDDATNIFKNILILLVTALSIDHENYLGPSIQQIIIHKMGLAKIGTPVMVSRQQDILDIKGSCIESMIKSYCKKNHIMPPVFVDKATKCADQYVIKTDDGLLSYNMLLSGDFQLQNSALAINCVLYLRRKYNKIAIFRQMALDHVQQGCLQAKWPGRMTWLYDNLLIDGAHNLQGIQVLVNYIQQYRFKTCVKHISWIVGISQGKNVKAMLDVLVHNTLKVDQSVCFTDFKAPKNMPWVKCIPAKDLQKLVPGSSNQSLPCILDNISTNHQTLYIICGSLYLVSSVYKYLKLDPWK